MFHIHPQEKLVICEGIILWFIVRETFKLKKIALRENVFGVEHINDHPSIHIINVPQNINYEIMFSRM